MTTLSDGTATVTFTDALMWVDEFAWSPVRQSVDPTITGGLVVQTGTLQAGQPITLAAEDDMSGWVTRSVLQQFKDWAAAPGLEMTLNYRGVNHTVIWRHQDTAIDAAPVAFFEDVQSGDFYRVTLRLMKV